MSERERPEGEPTGDEVYQPQPGEEVTDDAGLLDPADTLDDRGVDPALDEGYSPPEKPRAVDGRAGGDPERGALDERLAAERPERPDPADSDRARRTGRLVDGGSDDVTADDAGIAGGAASAEEAAVHTVDEDAGEGEDGGPGEGGG